MVMIRVCIDRDYCLDRFFLSDDRTREDDQDRRRDKYRHGDHSVMARDDDMADKCAQHFRAVRDFLWHQLC